MSKSKVFSVYQEESYFSETVRKITELAGVTTAVIAQCTGYSNISVRTLAIYHKKAFIQNIQYNVSDTPCECVVNGDACFYASNVQHAFPKDKDLVNLDAESYCGIPLTNDTKEIIGHIFILHNRPLKNKDKYISILQPFSIQVAAEMERDYDKSIFNSLVNAFNIRQGKDFFTNLAKHIQLILNADYVLISELIKDKKKASSLAVVHKSKLIDAIEYNLSDTPCEQVIRNIEALYASNVQAEFPNFQFLKDINAESYAGSLLLNNKGHAIGLISVLNTTKISNFKTYASIINIFAVRAADELNRRKIEQHLKDSEDKFRTLYDYTPAMFFNIKHQGEIVLVNEYGAKYLGYEVDDLIGKNISSIIHHDDLPNAQNILNQCFSTPDAIHHQEIKKLHKDGRVIVTRESMRVFSDNKREPVLFVVCEDISETYELSQQLSYQATHDALTGLINRSEFEHKLNSVIVGNRKDAREHALCYLDLDQFKVINDTCGHLAGDELLRQLSQILSSSLRKADTISRLGGDEFGVLMENCNIESAQVISESLRKVVEEFRFVWQDKKFSVGVSIGLVPISEKIGNVNEILSAADAACYAAKNEGRNRVHLYSLNDELVSLHRGQIQWVSRINEALEEGLFIIYRQKIIPLDPAANKGLHYEALIRMRSKTGEIVPPGAFLPAAERYGLSPKIDRWVIDNILNWLFDNPKEQNILNLLNINLSGQSLNNQEFMNYLIETLDNHTTIAKKICFEITETTAIANLASATTFIKKVKEKGCSFALDDFGSGVSSFGYLRNLPVDFLKIDGSFIRDIVTDKIDKAMVKSINEIGQLMGKKTIAEFVENDETLQEIKRLNVDYGQGYGIHKPEPLK